LGGGSSTDAIDDGGRPFQEENREPWVGFEGGMRWPFLAEEGTVERWQHAREPAAAASWVSGRRRKMMGGGAHASVREREGGGLGRP
jgi:hypothetical protein